MHEHLILEPANGPPVSRPVQMRSGHVESPMPVRLHVGDCLEVMKGLPDASVHAVVTDPPYGLTNDSGGPSACGQATPHGRALTGAARGGFMGLQWDADVPPVEVWKECLRVLKPGGYLLAFAATRTQHMMATRIEAAGFQIRDMIAWVYGSGFPKSHNGEWGGTALKPALEPITMARKPLEGTVEANWREHGTGALSIDACRVAIDPKADASQLRAIQRGVRQAEDGWGMSTVAPDGPQVVRPEGRWPANLIHDGSDEVLAEFPQSKGQRGQVSGEEPSSNRNAVYGQFNGRPRSTPRGDAGRASRFFYCAKPSSAERNHGLGQVEPQLSRGSTLRDAENLLAQGARKGNHHPTVKPTELMRYLCRLVTPVGGVVLDPYMGSGTTGRGAVLEGYSFIGIDLKPEYAEIARKRIEAVSHGLVSCDHRVPLKNSEAAERTRPGQLELF